MSHASIENAKVKKKIREALFTLLKKKKLSEITVTDIVTQAGVARASYYRNYDSKERIVEDYIDVLHDDIMSQIKLSDSYEIFAYDNIVDGFEKALTYFLQKKSYVMSIYQNGFGNLIQALLDRYIEEFVGDMPASSIERYKLYFISGAVGNILVHWLASGAVESPYEVAKIAANYLRGDILK